MSKSIIINSEYMPAIEFCRKIARSYLSSQLSSISMISKFTSHYLSIAYAKNLWVMPRISKSSIEPVKAIEAFQSEMAITHEHSSTPIAATYGLGPCISLSGYDPTNKIAFVIHFATDKEVEVCGPKLFSYFFGLQKKPVEAPLQVHLHGGKEGASNSTLVAIYNLLQSVHQSRPPSTYRVASIGVLYDPSLFYVTKFSRSIAVDARTGHVSSYDPSKNPKRRALTKENRDHAFSSAKYPDIKIRSTLDASAF